MYVRGGRALELGFLLAVYSIAQQALGAPIFDQSAFDGHPSTLVDFESLGDGTPYNLPEGGVGGVLGGQYGSLGFTIFAPDPLVVNASDADSEAALAQVGSLQTSLLLMGGSGDQVGFIFERDDIYSAGISIVRKTDSITGPLILRVRDRNASLIAEIEYDSSFIQGQIGLFDYGFIGFASDVPLGNFLFDFSQNNDIAIQYDDFVFSTEQVPAPSAAWAMLGAAGFAGTRRRR